MIRLHTPIEAANWLHSRITGQLHADSRALAAGDGFIAWPGAAVDARKHVNSVISHGVKACLIEDTGRSSYEFDSEADASLASYAGLKADAGAIAAQFYGHPSQKIKVLAVTGTNGKTSSTWGLAQALGKLGQRCAIVGTLGIGEPEQMKANGLTTPDPVLLQTALADFAQRGFATCAIEASSIGLAEQRLASTHIHTAVFTNFTQDHLDYHGSMAAYWQAKRALFDWPGLQSAVINIDGAQGAALAQELSTTLLDVWTVSLREGSPPARLQARDVRRSAAGLACEVSEAGLSVTLSTSGVADFSLSNLLGVLGALRALGVPLEAAALAASDLPGVPGRLETLVQPSAPLVVVDYAHTPDALEKMLSALRPLAAQRGGQLWCVFGCGGDRDAGKRPLMGRAAASGADRVVVTSDNPRSEDPLAIIASITQHLPRGFEVEPDRGRAIAHTLAQADAKDVVLLAGKGHEGSQEIAGVCTPFSDREQALNALKLRRREGAPA